MAKQTYFSQSFNQPPYPPPHEKSGPIHLKPR